MDKPDLAFYNKLYDNIEAFISQESSIIIDRYSKNTGQRNFPVIGSIKYNRLKQEFSAIVEISWYAKRYANPLEDFKRCVIKGFVIADKHGENLRFEVVHQNKHALNCKDSHWADMLYSIPVLGNLFAKLFK
ncbi:MAG: hypothetical protein KIS94_04990 [Chitinophagales bacterium]|nr:hypothetical protein [Chitinophagales bacterium]